MTIKTAYPTPAPTGPKWAAHGGRGRAGPAGADGAAGGSAADVVEFTAPDAASNWTAVNSPTSLNDLVHGLELRDASHTSGSFAIKQVLKALPTAPYTIVMGLRFNTFPNGGRVFAGMTLANGVLTTSDSIHIALDNGNGTFVLTIWKWDAVNAFNATYLTITNLQSFGNLLFIKVEDNNTNRIISVSPNGESWTVIQTISRTDYITPTHYGFHLEAGAGAGGFQQAIELVHIVVS